MLESYPEGEDHQNEQSLSDKAYLALSDLHNIFSSPSPSNTSPSNLNATSADPPSKDKSITSTATKTRQIHPYPLIAPKLLFYASNLPRIPRPRLQKEIDNYRRKLLAEEEEDVGLKEAVQEPLAIVGGLGRERTSAGLAGKMDAGRPSMGGATRAKIEEIW